MGRQIERGEKDRNCKKGERGKKGNKKNPLLNSFVVVLVEIQLYNT